MAADKVTNNGAVHETTASPGKDFNDDSAPEGLNDPVALYLRCRYDQREIFLKSRNDDERKKIGRELDRIEDLRNRLSSVADKETPKSNLIRNLRNSKREWKKNAFKNCKENLNRVSSDLQRHWKLQEEKRKARRTSHGEEKASSKEQPLSEEEKDRRIKNKIRILEIIKTDPTWKEVSSGSSFKINDSAIGTPTKVPGYGFNVPKITIEKHHTSPRQTWTSDKYKYEKFSITEILESESKYKHWKKTESGSIRYFHFPANNMEWIQKAIQSYEESMDEDHRYPLRDTLLCRELWEGQQHGLLNDPIHARHMRSHCSVVSSDTEPHNTSKSAGQLSPSKSKSDKHIVIFMPYLHWELDKRRGKMATLAKELTRKKRGDQSQGHLRNEILLADIADLVKQNRNRLGLIQKSKVGETDEQAVQAQDSKNLASLTYCGHFLLQAAKLYEEMDLEPDKKLFEDYLHEPSPVHPRRTLDQSYYFRLENTEPRDVDQVVYRGTQAGTKIHQNTRVVMVDQLWMYILDENTIITSFPKRLGRNKPDSSGVHKCIRSRLDHLPKGHVRSVYDLALIIMDECSKVFFDRTKPTDERPEVLDIFADAIGYVTEMKTIAFEGFWRHLRKSNSEGINVDTEMERIYLNINPEGELLREAHDIIEELRIMERIYSQQNKIASDFSKALEKLNQQPEPMQEIVHVLHDMLQQLTPKTQNHTRYSTSPKPKGVALRQAINNASDFVDKVSSRHRELQQLEESAREVADQIRDLLSLKQQQASIIEATSALDRADETVKQGRTIMVFTIITIIFLPLSFMSSLFGMNAKELSGSDGGVMSLREQFELMFPISFAMIAIFLTAAWKPSNAVYFLQSIAVATISGFFRKEKWWEAAVKGMDSRKTLDKKLSSKQRKMLLEIYNKLRGFEIKPKGSTETPKSALARSLTVLMAPVKMGKRMTQQTPTPEGSDVHHEEFSDKSHHGSTSNGDRIGRMV